MWGGGGGGLRLGSGRGARGRAKRTLRRSMGHAIDVRLKFRSSPIQIIVIPFSMINQHPKIMLCEHEPRAMADLVVFR